MGYSAPPPALAQVRHGDKSYDIIHQKSLFGSLDVYLALSKLLAGPGIRTFFLSTDDPTVIAQAKSVAEHDSSFLFQSDPDEKRFNGAHRPLSYFFI